VFVFVHGIFSDNYAWQYTDETSQRKQYWPYLIAHDQRLGGASVFLGGYNTGPNVELDDAMGELWAGLKDAGIPKKYSNIIFIAHSLGGIVVRRLLVHNWVPFSGKRIGVLLFASPSGGSYWANFFQLLNRPLITRLMPSDPVLEQLDRDFLDLLSDRFFADISASGRPIIKGQEMLEDTFLFGKDNDYIAPLQVVPKPSGHHYFDFQVIAATDHSSIVKPPRDDSLVHKLVVQFYLSFARSFAPEETVAEKQPPIDGGPSISPRQDRPVEPSWKPFQWPLPHGNLQPLDCNTQAVPSVPHLAPAVVQFTNLATKPMSLYWIDYEGKRRFYAALKPQQVYIQKTSLGHTWMAVNDQGECVAVFIPREQNNTALIVQSGEILVAPGESSSMPNQPVASVALRNEVWHQVEAWAAAIKEGDEIALRNFYAEPLERFYNKENASYEEVISVMLSAIRSYQHREINVSEPSVKITNDNAEVVFDKSYVFSGPRVATNQGEVVSRLRFRRTAWGWRIVYQDDDKICWSSVSSNLYLRAPHSCRE
jgi:pimeloyl-ACP methyl ester carboxylesterase